MRGFLAVLLFVFFLIGQSLDGLCQISFVSFETTNNKTVVCQNKSIGVIASISENFQKYLSYEWSGDSTSFREAKNEIAIVNTETPGDKIIKFTLVLSNEKRIDTTFTIAVLPAPEVLIFEEKGRIVLKNEIEQISSIKWLFNKAILPDNKTMELISPQKGTYHVVVTDNNGCSGVSQPLTIN